MRIRPVPFKRLRRLVAAGLVAPLLTACSWLTGVDEPDEMDLVLESDATELTVITSPFFLLLSNPDCEEAEECDPIIQLVEADTMVITPPFERTYAFTSRQQYFVEVWPTDGTSATVTMSIEIDGKSWYDDFRLVPALVPGEDQETVRFVYNFRELVL